MSTRRILPAPGVSALLFVFWLVLQQSLAPAQLLLAALVGWVVPLAGRRLTASRPRIRSVGALLRLCWLFAQDAVSSSWQTAIVVARAPFRPPRSRFVAVPLRLRDPHAIALLSVMTIIVPGSTWCDHDAEAGVALIHVLDLKDDAAEAQFIRDVQTGYEATLIEIFEPPAADQARETRA